MCYSAKSSVMSMDKYVKNLFNEEAVDVGLGGFVVGAKTMGGEGVGAAGGVGKGGGDDFMRGELVDAPKK